jgi:hypothetical protein
MVMITADELKIVADMTCEIVRIMQRDRPYVAIDILAPQIFGSLIDKLQKPDVVLTSWPPMCDVCGVSHGMSNGICPFKLKEAAKECHGG